MRKKRLIFPGLILILAAAALAQTPVPQGGQSAGSGARPAQSAQAAKAPSDLKALLTAKQSEMRAVIRRYEADRDQLSRFTSAPSPYRFSRLKRFDLDWAAALDELKADTLSEAAKNDLQTLKNSIQTHLKKIETDAAEYAQLGPLVPFADEIALLEQARMRMDSVEPEKAAVSLSKIPDAIAEIRSRLEAGTADKDKLGGLAPGKDLVVRAADSANNLRRILRNWFNFYNLYDPLFTWWMDQPYKQADKALEDYAAFLRDKVAPLIQEAAAQAAAPVDVVAAQAPKFAEVPDLQALLAFPQDEMRDAVQQFRRGLGRGGRGGSGSGDDASSKKAYLSGWRAALKKLEFKKLGRAGQIAYLYLRNVVDVGIRRLETPPQKNIPRKTDDSGITGRAIGRDALLLDLAEELIPYTPEQLIDLADRQYAWCESEMIKASRAMDCGDEWKTAIEKVKGMHVAPGKQPDAIRDLLFQADDYLRSHDLITVPEIEEETLRMEMMSPQRQLMTPFFTGGTLISVSFPTSAMTTRQKIESMRGNNIPFSHATAFHEMIPGHNMQDYMSPRFGANLSDLETSFWLEGWPVYWETLLYDLGFHETPEQRVGALFWRMHRCARIVFSLKFHLGEWSPQECVDYLIAKVGHERENAIAEVRRSFAGGYPPLYQAAYLLGALQMRELRQEFVDSNRMTLKQFHDAVIERGSMPIALLRLDLGGGKLARDMSLIWKCFGPNPGKK